MQTEGSDVRDFFNRIAPHYRDKYSERDAFLNYFFNERLAEATCGFDFHTKAILDIGAGTGNLYDRLIEIEPTIEYYATDISSEMLNQSNIPQERRFVGRLEEVDLPIREYDFIYVLGVTTYIDDDHFVRLLETLSSVTAQNGNVIMSCTNRGSIDWQARRMVRSIPSGLMPSRYVMSQDFPVYPRTVSEVADVIRGLFSIDDVRWLNHTVFPFNQIVKSASVKLAKGIHGINGKNRIKSLFSSDFLLVLKKTDNV